MISAGRSSPLASARSVRRASLAALALGVVLSTGACGFHPRGSLVGVDEPGRLFLDADRGVSIETPLRQALRERNFVIAANRDEADIVLRVAEERVSQRIVSVRSTGRVSEYELAHAVRVAIARSSDTPAGGEVPARAAPRRPDRVEVTREYTYDESQVLGKENEARILREEMSDELVRQIVLRTVASLARDRSEEAASVPADASPQ